MLRLSQLIFIQNRINIQSVRNNRTGIQNVWSQIVRGKRNDRKDESKPVSQLFQPATIKPKNDTEVGRALTGDIDKSLLLTALNKFSNKKEIRSLCKEHGLDGMTDFIS